jgi:protein SCO1
MKNLLYLFIGVIPLFNSCKSNNNKVLPIYGNREAVSRVVEGKKVTDTLYSVIPAFAFVNQYGDSIKTSGVKDRIYVADFFFVCCPSICPVMHRNMLKVYDEFKDQPDFRILIETWSIRKYLVVSAG